MNNKNDYDFLQVKETLKLWISTRYGLVDGQLHYTRIKPCIIAEKLFVNEKNKNSNLTDYKIYCFNGVPECIIVVGNREKKENYNLTLYDLEWNNISQKCFDEDSSHYNGVNFTRPKSLDQMIDAATKLSQGFPQVRVDFYDIDDKAIFGEMTFTTGFPPFNAEYWEYLGSKIDVAKVKRFA